MVRMMWLQGQKLFIASLLQLFY